MTLGLRRLDPAQWLQVDEHREDELALKARLLADRHDELVVHLPAGDEAAAQTLDAVVGWLASHRPDLPRTPVPGLHPIDAAGRLVQEDLCVLTRDQGAWVLTAASVCFPSRWAPRQKLGLALAAVHDPVPGYQTISAPVDASLDRLTDERPLWRLNWSVLPSPALCQLPGDHPRAAAAAAGYPGIDGLTFRVERQTLRRLPGIEAVVFTIRTTTAPLREVVVDPHRAGDLNATLAGVSPAHADYKGWTGWLDRLRADLADVAAGGGLDTRARRDRPDAADPDTVGSVQTGPS
jgi:hypothetical protein